MSNINIPVSMPAAVPEQNAHHRCVAIDCETTGLYCLAGDRIVEVAAVEYIDRKASGRVFHKYVNPGRDVPADAVAIHGLDNAFLADKPSFAEIAHEFVAFCAGDEIVIQNAPFDLGFVNMELARVGLSYLQAAAVIDTLVYSKREGVGKRHSLDALCDRFGIERKHRSLHGGLTDAVLLGEVYINLTRGQESLGMDFLAAADVAAAAAAPAECAGNLLVLVSATPEECGEHEVYLARMAKESGGKCLWID